VSVAWGFAALLGIWVGDLGKIWRINNKQRMSHNYMVKRKDMERIDTKTIQIVIGGTVVACLFLANVVPNVFSLWVLLPLIVIYARTIVAGRKGKKRHIAAVVGFLIPVVPLMWFVHIQWYFDINGAATGSSTSVLIFAVLPVYCFILGVFGYAIGYAVGSK
jgi:F0F1-type ATP synthase assembly protein I